MSAAIVRGARPRSLWCSALTGKFMWHLPRVRQWAAIVTCGLRGHSWGRWRRETEEWFEYVDAPLPWAWRMCERCRLSERVLPGDDL